MKTWTALPLVYIAGLIAGDAFQYAHGDDARASRRIEAEEPFARVHVNGAATVNISQGDPGGQPRIELTATADTLDDIRVKVTDGTLHVEVKDGSAHDGVTIDLDLPTLSEFVGAGAIKFTGRDLHADSLVVKVHGTGDYHFDDLAVDELLIEARGASRFRLDGAVRRQVVDIAGSGVYEALALTSKTSRISLKGAGRANVAAAETLAVRIAGAGTVRYTGSPELRQRIFGAGVVKRLDD